MAESLPQQFRIRSFVRRSGRKTSGQQRAYEELWPQLGLSLALGQLNFSQIFAREAPCFLEIGFGTGQSLLALAAAHPEWDFIGVETHRPGIGALCLGIAERKLTNVRIFDADVVDVLAECIPDASLASIQIFFPDPWQKRRHHARRLIQPDLVKTMVAKLCPQGTMHLATDWEDYSVHMMKVLSQVSQLVNLVGEGQFSERSSYRPVLTKFEQRAQRQGRSIWDLQFMKRI